MGFDVLTIPSNVMQAGVREANKAAILRAVLSDRDTRLSAMADIHLDTWCSLGFSYVAALEMLVGCSLDVNRTPQELNSAYPDILEATALPEIKRARLLQKALRDAL